MSKQIAIVIFLTSVASCFNSSKQSSSYNLQNNGVITNKAKFPNVVYIQISKGSEIYEICTGTFMGNYVLTAAHCVLKNPKSSSLETMAPNSILLSVHGDPKEVSPTKIEIHPKWEPGTFDSEGQLPGGAFPDLAKLYLPKRTWTRVTPARIASKTPSKDDIVTVVGYGLSSNDTADINKPIVFRSGENKILTTDYRYIVTRGLNYANPGNRHTMTFLGDSGGPLFNSSNEIIGVTSFGGPIPSWGVGHESNTYTNITSPFLRSWLTCR